MRYVHNALAGRGFTFNPGEPSYGCTSALWVFVMTPIAKLFGNNVWTWKIASSILFGLRASVLYLFLSRFRISKTWILILTLAVVIEPHSFRWASSGMENSLAILLLTGAGYLFWLCTEEPSVFRVVSVAVLAGLLPFARPEFAPISLAISVFVVFTLKDKRLIAIFFASILATVLFLAAIVWFCFSALIPQSSEAKAALLQLDNRFYALLQCGKIVLTGCLVPLAILILSRGISRATRYWSVAALFCFCTAILYLGYRNHLVSTRYASYLCAPVALAAVIVIAERIAAGGRRLNYAKALVALQIAISLGVLAYLFPATRVGDYQDIKQVADLVASKTDGKARIALSEVGAFGFYSDRYIIDLIGLTDRETLSWARQNKAIEGRDRFESLLIARGATHYVANRSEQTPERMGRGKRLNYTLMFEVTVKRDLMNSGEPVDSVWRVYEFTGKDSPQRH